jgi:hypothetical protein
MAKDKKSFLLYADYNEVFEELTDQDAGKLIKHILKYVNDEDPISDNPLVKLSFIPIKKQLKRDLEKYEKIVKRNSINGSKGGRPKNPINPLGSLGNPLKPKKADTDNDTVTDTDTDNVILLKKETKGYLNEKLNFDLFWNLFDKKIGNKKSCAKKWDRFTFDLQNDILNHVEAYVISTPDKQYRCNPETYFNQQRWTNEIILKDGTDQQNNKQGVSKLELATLLSNKFDKNN